MNSFIVIGLEIISVLIDKYLGGGVILEVTVKKGVISLLLLGIVAVLLLLGLTVFGPWDLPGFGQLSQRQEQQKSLAAEGLWPPPGDTDQDGFTDTVEKWIKTDPTDNCSDDANDAAWPPDINNDKKVDQADGDAFKPYMFSSEGHTKYNRRFDLNADKKINVGDTLLLRPYFDKGCPFQFLTADAKSSQVDFNRKPGGLVVSIVGYNLTKNPSLSCETGIVQANSVAFTEGFRLDQTFWTWNKSAGGDKFVYGDNYCASLLVGDLGAVSNAVNFTIPAPTPPPYSPFPPPTNNTIIP